MFGQVPPPGTETWLGVIAKLGPATAAVLVVGMFLYFGHVCAQVFINFLRSEREEREKSHAEMVARMDASYTNAIDRVQIIAEERGAVIKDISAALKDLSTAVQANTTVVGKIMRDDPGK